MVQFQFWAGNHTVTQSNFDNACVPLSTSNSSAVGIDSGHQPVSDSAAMGMAPTFTIMVNDTKPLWFYCATGTHCQSGMSLVINEEYVTALWLLRQRDETDFDPARRQTQLALWPSTRNYRRRRLVAPVAVLLAMAPAPTHPALPPLFPSPVPFSLLLVLRSCFCNLVQMEQWETGMARTFWKCNNTHRVGACLYVSCLRLCRLSFGLRSFVVPTRSSSKEEHRARCMMLQTLVRQRDISPNTG